MAASAPPPQAHKGISSTALAAQGLPPLPAAAAAAASALHQDLQHRHAGSALPLLLAAAPALHLLCLQVL